MIKNQRKVKPKIRLKVTEDYKFVNDVVQKNKLNTVCEEARCPIFTNVGIGVLQL